MLGQPFDPLDRYVQHVRVGEGERRLYVSEHRADKLLGAFMKFIVRHRLIPATRRIPLRLVTTLLVGPVLFELQVLLSETS